MHRNMNTAGLVQLKVEASLLSIHLGIWDLHKPPMECHPLLDIKNEFSNTAEALGSVAEHTLSRSGRILDLYGWTSSRTPYRMAKPLINQRVRALLKPANGHRDLTDSNRA